MSIRGLLIFLTRSASWAATAVLAGKRPGCADFLGDGLEFAFSRSSADRRLDQQSVGGAAGSKMP
jgi:hypothetical protein